jgi:hypothetical protein
VAQVYRIAGIEAARIAGDSAEMDAVADRLVLLAKSAAAEHNDSGTFSRSIRKRNVRGKRGVRDRVVEATDPLAAIKEFGHVIRRDGDDIGYVPGQHSMQKAWRRMPRTGK